MQTTCDDTAEAASSLPPSRPEKAFSSTTAAHSDNAPSKGGQIGNTNAATHCLRMAVGTLPSGCRRITGQVMALRRTVEAALAERHNGEISTYQAAVVNSMCRWEQTASLCQRWLRLHSASLTHADRLRYVEAIAKASDARDRCIERLGLDKEQSAVDRYFAAFEVPHGS